MQKLICKMKKKVLIDLKFLSFINNGFGQLCLQYGNFLKENPDLVDDANLDITLFVPREYVGKFGDHVNYLTVSKKYKLLPFLLPHFDIWHCTTQVTRYMSISSRTRRIITIHDLNFLYELSGSGIEKRLKRLQLSVEMADKLIVISKFTENEIRNNLDVKNLPIELNYVGIRDITHDIDSKPKSVDENRKYFFTVGHILKKKNFHVLLDMMKLMPDHNLYIAGVADSEYANEIKKQIEEKKIDNVFLTGALTHSEKVWMYKHCYAFVFPSLFEGFGIPIIEAMMFDKPVFSSRCTSLNEIGGKYAFFWQNFEAEHMKQVIDDNIEKFYKDDKFRKEQMEYAFSFSIDRHMKYYLEIYRNMPITRKRNLKKFYSNTLKYYKKGIF